MSTLDRAARFLAAQRHGHRALFAGVPDGTLIGMLATTVSGPPPACGLNRIVSLKAGDRGRGVELTLDGALPHEPSADELISACVVDLPRYRGYQIKSASGGPGAFARAESSVVINGKSVYTVHHSPNVLNVFENIPFEELRRDVAHVRHAFVGVGRRVNVSPRFIFHFEHENGELLLFHGDGLVHKTYLNLRENGAVTYLVHDPEKDHGYSMRGICHELSSGERGQGPDRVREGFAALGFQLTKLFVTAVSAAVPVAA